MNLHTLELVEDREVWIAAVHQVQVSGGYNPAMNNARWALPLGRTLCGISCCRISFCRWDIFAACLCAGKLRNVTHIPVWQIAFAYRMLIQKLERYLIFVFPHHSGRNMLWFVYFKEAEPCETDPQIGSVKRTCLCSPSVNLSCPTDKSEPS